MEHVTIEQVTQAYYDCRRRKRRKESALAYELEYEINNLELYDELNSGMYEVGRSICFCVTRPKLREVFAASFRDRVVHHILMNKIMWMLEDDMIDDSYSCRVGKGVLHGVKRIEQMARKSGKDAWCLCLDISGFFMSINRDLLYSAVKDCMYRHWDRNDSDIEWWLELTRKIIYNRPEIDCEIRGDASLFDLLPEHKSLFHSNGKGLPIGNITSQVFANFYLSILDRYISSMVSGYGRYVDDLRLIDCDKRKLLAMIPDIREKLAMLGLRLNEKKTSLQRADKGIPFTGYIIQPYGIYEGCSLRRNALRMSGTLEDIDRHITRMNSYLGFLSHTLSYSLRSDIIYRTYSLYSGIYAKNKFKSIHKTKAK